MSETAAPVIHEKTSIAKFETRPQAPVIPEFIPEKKPTAVKSWVFRKDPGYYTVQLIASSNKEAIEDFIKKHKDQKRLSYFHTIKDNKNWYVVVKGTYPSFSEAEKARKALPQALAKYGAWVRSYHSIQKDITANAEKLIRMSNLQ